MLTLERVVDGDYVVEYRVFAHHVLVGFVAWRHDAPSPAWYFEGNLTLGLDSDGGVYFWLLAWGEDNEHIAISKFKRRFYAVFRQIS